MIELKIGLNELLTVLIPAILIIAANIIQIIAQSRQLKVIRKELEDRTAVIKDTSDLRSAVMHKLEGTWTLVGTFSKFQGDNNQYRSDGFLSLTWNQNRENYDAIYCYSVTKAWESTPVVTAISKGFTEEIKKTNSHLNFICFTFNIMSRTIRDGSSNYSNTFSIKLKPNNARDGGEIVDSLIGKFETPSTSGELAFTKTN